MTRAIILLLLLFSNRYGSATPVAYQTVRDSSAAETRQSPAGHATVIGQVVDEHNHPLTSVSVILRSTSPRADLVSVSDGNGRFIFKKISQGQYNLTLKCLGFAEHSQMITVGRNDLLVEPVTLRIQTNLLNDVLVNNKQGAHERQLDRMVYLTGSSVLQNGGNTLEALRRVPGLRTGTQGISLAGKGNVLILIDDKILRMEGEELSEYLSSLPAENIEKIEVLNNPPAQYEAQGKAGFINIVLKRQAALGYSAMLNLNQARNSKALGRYNASFNANFPKLRLNFSPSYNYANSVMFANQFIYFPDNTWDQREFRHLDNQSLRLALNTEYDLNKTSSLSAQYAFTQNWNGGVADNRGSFFSHPDAPDSMLVTRSRVKVPRVVHIFSISSESKIGRRGLKLANELSFYYNGLRKSNDFQTSALAPDGAVRHVYSPVRSSSRQFVRITGLNTDLTLPGRLFTMSAGLRAVFIDINNNAYYNASDQLSIAQNSLFYYNENTQSGYVNLEKKSEKWELNIGVRSEYTQSKGYSKTLDQLNKRHYIEFFPSLAISFSPNEDNVLSLSASRRITRPGYAWLDPFRLYLSVNAYTEGNPYLMPFFTKSVILTHSLKEIFTTSIEFRQTKDEFEKINVQNGDQNYFSQAIINRNFLNQKSVHLNIGYTYDKLPWLQSENTINCYHTDVRSGNTLTNAGLSGWGNYLSSTNNLSFSRSRNLRAGLMFNYQFPEISGMDRMKRTWQMDLALSYKFKGNKFGLTANAIDIFKTSSSAFSSIINKVPQYYYQYNDVREFRLSLLYKFNKGKSSDNQKLRNTDEWKRAN